MAGARHGVSVVSAVAEGWFVGAMGYLVLLALGSALLFVWPAPAAIGDRVGAALVLLACAIGAGHGGRRLGHGGLAVGAAVGLCVAAGAALPALVGGDGGVIWGRLMAGAVAGAIGGALGVALGTGPA